MPNHSEPPPKKPTARSGDSSPRESHWPETRWDWIEDAKSDDPVVAKRALNRIASEYREPVLKTILKSGRVKPQDAEDLCQSFFADSFRRGTIFADADPKKGKLRNLFGKAIEHHMINHFRNQNTLKRSPGTPLLSLEEAPASSISSIDGKAPEGNYSRVFDREWAFGLFHSAINALELDYATDPATKQFFEVARPYIFAPPADGSLSEFAEKIEISENAFSQRLHRMRKRFGDLFRAAVARTVRRPHEIDEELRYLTDLLISYEAPLTPPGK